MFILGSYYTADSIAVHTVDVDPANKICNIINIITLTLFSNKSSANHTFSPIVTLFLSLDYLQILMGGLGYQYEYPRVAKVTCKNIH